jgi:hypothetical protein
MVIVAKLDPPQIEWSISTGISQGNPGTVIASGTAKSTLTPTGRSWSGLNEYTALGLLNGDELVTLAPGHYWMADVEEVPAPHAKGFESTDESYFEAPSDGWNYAETGGPSGVCGQGGGCDKFSAGLLGTATLDN